MSVSNSLQVPGTYVGISAIRAQSGALPFRSILIGQKLAAGTEASEQLFQIFSKEDAEQKAGIGSMLAEMADYWFRNNNQTPIYCIALDDAGAATAATQTVTFTGPSTAGGSVNLYINNELYQVGVTSGDSASDVAAAVDAFLDQYPALPHLSLSDSAGRGPVHYPVI